MKKLWIPSGPLAGVRRRRRVEIQRSMKRKRQNVQRHKRAWTNQDKYRPSTWD